MHEIMQEAATLFGLSLDELRGPSRARHISEARQAVAYALRQRTPLSFAAIAHALGRSDHTTIVYAVSAAEQRAVANPAYALALSALARP